MCIITILATHMLMHLANKNCYANSFSFFTMYFKLLD